MGQHIIILNDVQTAIDLLEKRSSIYSDRFSSIFGRHHVRPITPLADLLNFHLTKQVWVESISRNVSKRASVSRHSENSSSDHRH